MYLCTFSISLVSDSLSQQERQFVMGSVGELQIIPDTLQPDCVKAMLQEGRISPVFVLRMI